MRPDDSLGVLPRGRHHLSREQVRASQRGRLLLGMAEAVAEHGYVHTSVRDVLVRVRVSRETFYQHFADKQDCFLAAFDQAAEVVLTATGDALGSPRLPALLRLDRLLDAYLGILAEEPALAKTFLIEVYAAGEVAVRRRLAVQQRFVDLLLEVLSADERWTRLPDPRFACQTVVGAVSALVTARVATGEHAELPGLRQPMVDLVAVLLDGAVGRQR